MTKKTAYIMDIRATYPAEDRLLGGKGANLAALSAIESIEVPAGFCITTAAFEQVIGSLPQVGILLEQLAQLKAEDRDGIGRLSAALRQQIETAPVPGDLEAEIGLWLSRSGMDEAYAVRSSATAEDLPDASFAGQQDTYLNITGKAAILAHISKCWASLFSERAVTYRIRNGFDHRKVSLAVIVQQMVPSRAAGVLFTADPMTGNRKISAIDAGFGLGEALVSGLVNADHYLLREGSILEKKIAVKRLAIYAAEGGGTEQVPLTPEEQLKPVLSDAQLLVLESIGRKIEAHFSKPQDIEWCLYNGVFYIVQSRPITTLYPVPDAGEGNHIYISVGHQQMMTDAMKPLGLSLWQLTASAPMFPAGGRLFVDVGPALSSPAGRRTLIDTLGQSDPLIRSALTTITARADFVPLTEDPASGPDPRRKVITTEGFRTKIENDPAIVAGLIRDSQAAIEAAQRNILAQSGPELFDFIREDIRQLKQSLKASQSMAVILAVMDAFSWLNEKMMAWLGEKNVADLLSQSVHGNITSEMGLALMDIADVIRPYPEVVAFLQQTTNDNFMDALPGLAGGAEARAALEAYLEQYGMRCAGEIDITRKRWSEKPRLLLPALLNNIRNFAPGAGRQRWEQGRRDALRKEQELLRRLALLPDAKDKIAETKRMIDLVRNFAGYREYPKYRIISHYFIWKLALLREAARLVEAGLIAEEEDIFYLSFDELEEAVRTKVFDPAVIRRRREEHIRNEKLTPPRVITSEGEIITGAYLQDALPAGALPGLAVSSGVIEGRARVIFSMEDAVLEEGDILVTPFTDPSWTPLFVSIKGLVTEVGGRMTHGAVIAREYGLPAVVGVEQATRLIRDGQRIRVNGTEGYVVIL
ncbi:rifamycin-inactivating phosphotransferase [Taibaiella helva]|uniref:rifamycin-inactivating phosphotransferase n=1 Tax=Taibaiella helva TaxID=2301235 RepID=UPI0018E4EEDD|nr:rifamycin-inactivating phosphotransferase [Taibaiella helva]